jgi:hypothetical protein
MLLVSKPLKQLKLFSLPEERTTPAAKILRWRCPNCGQQIFTNPDENPPDMCAYCQDMTTWQCLSDDNAANSDSS